METIGRMRFQGTSAKVNFALDGLPTYPALLGTSDHYRGFVNTGPSMYLQRAFDAAKYGWSTIFAGEFLAPQMYFIGPLGYSDYRTPIQGYYQCGSGTHPGGCVIGAPGKLARQRIMADRAAGWGRTGRLGRCSLTGMSKSSRVTSKGQVTIPQELRIEYGFHPETVVRFEVVEGRVTLRHDQDPGLTPGRRLVARMWGTADGGMTTDEIMALTRE